jgi:hypothetical protein
MYPNSHWFKWVNGVHDCQKIWDRSKENNLHYKFMISDGDSKAYGSIWDTYGCCADCEKWENINKCSAEYKKWHESKAYVEWKESHESGNTLAGTEEDRDQAKGWEIGEWEQT